MVRGSLVKAFLLVVSLFFTPFVFADESVKEFKIYHSLGYKEMPDIANTFAAPKWCG